MKINNLSRTNDVVRFISAAVLGIAATLCTILIAIPYYWGYKTITNGSYFGWVVIGVWTWLMFTFAFHMMMKWIDKGREQKKKEKQFDESAKKN